MHGVLGGGHLLERLEHGAGGRGADRGGDLPDLQHGAGPAGQVQGHLPVEVAGAPVAGRDRVRAAGAAGRWRAGSGWRWGGIQFVYLLSRDVPAHPSPGARAVAEPHSGDGPVGAAHEGLAGSTRGSRVEASMRSRQAAAFGVVRTPPTGLRSAWPDG
jgi:hypothetical protein